MDCSNQSSQSVITCRNSQGTELTANLLRTDMASTLSGVRHWLTGVDVGIRTTVIRRRDELEKEIRECEESDLAEIDLLDFITMAKPGGLVIVTNVSDSNPSKAWMEYLVEWNLIYRGRKDMQDLVPDVPIKNTAILSDKTGVNLFLEIELANG